MPSYQVLLLTWTREEDVMLAYFHSRGFEISDVARIMEYKLQRRARTQRECMRRMERINQHRVRDRLPRLCEDGMANWDRAAVDDYLIHSTYDTQLLKELLTFHTRYIPLLRAVCPPTASLGNLMLMAT